jgi:hypothetical protein
MKNEFNISEHIDYVMDLVDRGEIGSVEEGLVKFEGLKVDMELVKKCLVEEFEEGYSDNWELVEC